MAQKADTLGSSHSANPVGTEVLAINDLLKRKSRAGSLMALRLHAVPTQRKEGPPNFAGAHLLKS